MAFPLAGATGDLFNVLGRLGKMISNVRDYQDTQEPAMISLSSGVVGQLENESDIQAIMGSQYTSILNSAGATAVGGLCQSLAEAVLSRKVYRYQAQFNQTLVQQNPQAAMNFVLLQMLDQGATVLAPTVTAVPRPAGAPNGPYFIGAGTGIINASVIRPSDGRTCENSYAEVITFVCTSDSYLNNTPVGNEGFSVTGQGQDSSVFDFDWPLGSDCSASPNAIDGNADNSEGNYLTNSGFEDWTSGVPDNWELVTGTTSNIAQQGSIVYDGSYALEFIGDSTTQTQLRQVFNSSTGTNGNLLPLSTYSFCVFMRRGGGVPSAGVITFDLTDANGVVLQDAAGNNVTFSTNASALTTSYVGYTANFRTSHVMPSSLYLRMRLSTALDSGTSIYVDKASLGDFTRLYGFGPYVAIHAGNIPFQSGDYAYLDVTNSRGAGNTLNTWQTLWFRLFNALVTQNDLLIPSSSSPTISDALITA